MITATLPADRVVHAKPGDQIALDVHDRGAGHRDVVNLAVKAPVGPGITSPIPVQRAAGRQFPRVLELAGP